MNGQRQRERIRVREDAVLWRELDGETVLLALESSLYLTLNATGTVLWPLLVRGATTVELVDALVARFDVTRDRAQTDTAAFIATCRAQRLLETYPGPG